MAPDVRPGHGRDHHVGLRHGGDEPRVVVERRLHEASTLPFEGQQHLELIDVEADLRPHQDERGVSLRQARPHYPAADVAGATHDEDAALLHGSSSVNGVGLGRQCVPKISRAEKEDGIAVFEQD